MLTRLHFHTVHSHSAFTGKCILVPSVLPHPTELLSVNTEPCSNRTVYSDTVVTAQNNVAKQVRPLALRNGLDTGSACFLQEQAVPS